MLGTTKGYVYQEIGNTQEGNSARGHGQYRRVYRMFSAAEPFSFLEETIVVSLGLGYFSVISFTRYGRILVWERGVVKVNRLCGD
jgi:hypothetical protein